jgi:hypothetical protein
LFSNQTFNPSVDTRGSLSTLSPLLFYKNHINLSANHAQPSPHCRNEISGKHFLPLSFPFVSLSLSLSLSPLWPSLSRSLTLFFFFVSHSTLSLSLHLFLIQLPFSVVADPNPGSSSFSLHLVSVYEVLSKVVILPFILL